MRARGLVAVACACLLAAGCSGGKHEPELRPGVLRIGVVLRHDRWGPEIVNGVRAAAREINRGGGIEEEVRLHLLFGDPRRLAAARVRFLIPPCDPRAEVATLAVVRRAIAFAPCNARAGRRLKRLWPVSASRRQEADAVADYLDHERYDRVAVVGDGALARAVERKGLRIVGVDGADAVAVGLASPRAQIAVARLRARGVESPVVATHGLDDLRAVRHRRRALEGVTFVTFAYPEPGLETDEFYERYRALTGHRPDGSIAALGYDAVKVLVAAVEEAVSIDPKAVATAMPGLEAHGATGTIAYPKRGTRDPDVTMAIVQIKHGRLVLLDHVDV